MPLAFVAILALTVAVVMWLWNWLMPALFGLVTITYWQALGLLTLVRLLFGGHPFAGQHHQRGYRGHFHHDHWRKMSGEEREAFRERMRAFRDRRGFGPSEDRRGFDTVNRKEDE